MEQILCQMCNTIVKYGECHSCFLYKNDNDVYTLPDFDGESLRYVDASVKNPVISQESINIVMECSSTNGNVLDQNNRKMGSESSKELKYWEVNKASQGEENLVKVEPYLSETVEDNESNVRVTAEKDFEKLKFERHSTSDNDKDCEHTNRLPNNMISAQVVGESGTQISRGIQPLSEYITEAVAGLSGRQNIFSRIVQENVLCEECGAEFSNKRDFESHCRTHPCKNFKCDVCNKAFSCKDALKTHYRIHTGEKPFVCYVCNRSFARKDHLTEHYRLHTVEKPFKCVTCGMSFVRSSELSSHIRFHTEDEPFKCRECGKVYSRQKSLNQHCKLKHS